MEGFGGGLAVGLAEAQVEVGGRWEEAGGSWRGGGGIGRRRTWMGWGWEA